MRSEASWIGYRSQGVQPVFVEVIDPVHAELIKVQREVFNRVLENLKPGVTVGELAELTLQTGQKAAPKSGPAAGAKAISTCMAAAQGTTVRSLRRTPKSKGVGGGAAREYGFYLQAVGDYCGRPVHLPLGVIPWS